MAEVLNARIGFSTISRNTFLEVIQGEEKTITFIVEATGGFFVTDSFTTISVKLSDSKRFVLAKSGASITRVCEELDVQVFRLLLTSANTAALARGTVDIEIALDNQKARISSGLKILASIED